MLYFYLIRKVYCLLGCRDRSRFLRGLEGLRLCRLLSLTRSSRLRLLGGILGRCSFRILRLREIHGSNFCFVGSRGGKICWL
jgi:hypothetical protein